MNTSLSSGAEGCQRSVFPIPVGSFPRTAHRPVLGAQAQSRFMEENEPQPPGKVAWVVGGQTRPLRRDSVQWRPR